MLFKQNSDKSGPLFYTILLILNKSSPYKNAVIREIININYYGPVGQADSGLLDGH